jgi:hypothetical protein
MGLLNFSPTESCISLDNTAQPCPSNNNPISPQSTKLNFLTIKISDGQCYFADGVLDGELFKRGATVTIESNCLVSTSSNKSFSQGEWSLHRTIAKGHPAIVCTFFNKRSQMMEQRYLKIFFKDGLYRCGPRFPKKIHASSKLEELK